MTKLGDREIPSQPARFAGGGVQCAEGDEHDHRTVTGVLFRRPDASQLINCEVFLEGVHQPVHAFSYLRMTMTFGDELIGQAFGDIRRQFRERDLAHAGALAKTLKDHGYA